MVDTVGLPNINWALWGSDAVETLRGHNLIVLEQMDGKLSKYKEKWLDRNPPDPR